MTTTFRRSRGMRRIALGVVCMGAVIALGTATASAGPGESAKPCYWANAACDRGSIAIFDTRNSGFYSRDGLGTAGAGGQQKSLRVNRAGVGYLGWWHSNMARFDIGFAGFNNQQSWCGNTGSIVQNMWCDMWAVGV